MKKILVLGGYGVFGKRICERLSRIADIELIIAGRSFQKAERFKATLGDAKAKLRTRILDTTTIETSGLEEEKLFILINASGPFHLQDRRVPQFCIAHGIHYIDLADNRDYVTAIEALDEDARKAGVLVTSGASSVPAISAAMVDELSADFTPEILEYGISPGNRTERGTGTVAAILSYTGKPFQTLIDGTFQTIHGWQNIHRENYPRIGKRWMGNCNIPDLDLFPKRYPGLKTQRFKAGLESSPLHLGLWLLSWPMRWGWLKRPERLADILRRISLMFLPFGSDTGGMHIKLSGHDEQGRFRSRQWFLLVEKGMGPHIPASPSVILAKKLLSGEKIPPGARPCIGMFSAEDFRAEIVDLKPRFIETRPIYRNLLGQRFDALPPVVQQLHDLEGQAVYQGTGNVTRGKNIFCRFLARLMALPPDGPDQPLTVAFHQNFNEEHWTRHFGGQVFHSVQMLHRGRLYEKINIITLIFDVKTSTEMLSLKLKDVTVMGIPVGWLFKPDVRADEREEDGRFHVDIEVTLPLFGLLVRYDAMLERANNLSQ